jgi:hypothetical protein
LNGIRLNIRKLRQQHEEFGGAWPQHIGDLVFVVGSQERA